jgi:hypothetical protein
MLELLEVGRVLLLIGSAHPVAVEVFFGDPALHAYVERESE